MLGVFLVAGCTTGQADPNKPHHVEGKFRNVHPYDPPGLTDFIKWRWNALWKEIPEKEAYDFALTETYPDYLQSNASQTTLTWIGHATLLLQVDGKNILTDPQFSKRASPVQWAGPERVVEPGISLDQLPVIDAVIISHDHYDSLDSWSIKQLHQRPGGDETLFYVPLGLKDWFEDHGIHNVVELDWWEDDSSLALKITAVPVQHWSKRTAFSRNDTLWAGWVVETPGFKFFFGGDSGYTPHFKEIGDAFGGFDLAAIPIGAYEPRWFMKAHHISPEEAVQVHLDVRAKRSVGIHWGTFILTDEPLDEPPRLLEAEMRRRGIDRSEFIVMEHGETRMLSKDGQLTALPSKPVKDTIAAQ